MRITVEVSRRKRAKTRLRRLVYSVRGPFQLVLSRTQHEESLMFQIRDDVETPVEFAITKILDKKGNPTTIPSPPTWTANPPTMVVLTVEPDGMSVGVIPADGGGLGVVQLNAKVEGDPIPGVDTITGSFSLEIVAGEAASIVIAPVPPLPG